MGCPREVVEVKLGGSLAGKLSSDDRSTYLSDMLALWRKRGSRRFRAIHALTSGRLASARKANADASNATAEPTTRADLVCLFILGPLREDYSLRRWPAC